MHMEDEGILAFEIGIHQAEAVCELCRAGGFVKTAVRRDYADIERMVFAVKARQNATEEDMERYDKILTEAVREL